jgi:DNA-directed RNA polymerase subunit beta
VLLKEMQSLALDVNVVSEEGQRTEMRDEDDDLLRAAEELGIDLSGVRAPAAADDAPAEGEEESEAAAEATDSTDDTTTSAEESLEIEDEDVVVEELEVQELLAETTAVGDDAIATDETVEDTP